MAGEIFISYSRDNHPFAQELIRELDHLGYAVWSDAKIRPGENWPQEIEQALRRAEAIVFVVSGATTGSLWQQRELIAAYRVRRIPIIPVVFPESIDSVPAELRDVQWSLYQGDLDAVVADVAETLGDRGKGTSPDDGGSRGYVFLSHATEDEAFVRLVSQFLETRGYAWWGFHTSDRKYGLSIARELEGRIDESKAMIAVLSPSWRTSDWTERELLYAEAIGKHVFLLQAEAMRPSILVVGRLVLDYSQLGKEALNRLGAELSRRGL